MADRETYRESLKQWAECDDVRRRGIGVIGLWLLDNTTVDDPHKAASKLIGATADAGLITMIKTDLDAHIDAIVARRAH